MELVKAWEIVADHSVLSKNIDALETLDYYRKHINSNVDELSASFKSASNKEDWFSARIAEIRSKARKLPGTSTGEGFEIIGDWMRGTEGNLGLFPKAVADKLRGRTFKNFDEFRSEFWKTVAEDPGLVNKFTPSNITRMRQGNAPRVVEGQQWGKRLSYEIHHKTPIHDGGDVYDIDNMVIVTPRYHK